jgi:ligand-binding SRPBCC domain-containing protein
MRGTLHILERSQVVASPLERTFAFFADAASLERLTPPWLRFRILTRLPIEMREGALIEYRLSLHGLPLRWRTAIARWEPGRCFVDLQLRGPYAFWEHTHTFEPAPGGTLISDRVRYRLPLAPLGELAHALLVARDLEQIFDYRRDAAARELGSGYPTGGRR